jgi:signal transduction histidine kinase
MKTLYLRIYLTVVAVLALFAVGAGWYAQRHIEVERASIQGQAAERVAAWATLLENSLPPADAPAEEQSAALIDWSSRLRIPLALDDARGTRLATSPSFARREAEGGPRRVVRVTLSDGRGLWVMGPGRFMRGGPPPEAGALHPDAERGMPPARGEEGPASRMVMRERTQGLGLPPWMLVGGQGMAAALVVLFVAVAAGAYPVVRRLTRRLETLKRGVEVFGAGALDHRVDDRGRDEVAAVAASFNRAAARIESLVKSNRSLLANASHELRSPLARLKMALAMLTDAPAEQREQLRHEIDRDIRELDALVEEVLLASRLDASTEISPEPIDVLALCVEEGARVGAQVDGARLTLRGDERLLRRALRNLLENARRYGGLEPPQVELHQAGTRALLKVCDRGPGVPPEQRERIFEPFYRMPGHAEHAGGVGLGLSLVRQIAERHGGSVRCEPRDGGGSCFVLEVPVG